MDVMPDRHFARSALTPGYTPCGKLTQFVVITFDPDRVTCPVCLEELATARAVS